MLKCAENLSSDQKQFVEIGANLLWLFFIANRRLAGAQHYLLDITHNAMMGALALTLFMFYVSDLGTGTGIAKRENGAARYTCRCRAGVHDIVV